MIIIFAGEVFCPVARIDNDIGLKPPSFAYSDESKLSGDFAALRELVTIFASQKVTSSILPNFTK